MTSFTFAISVTNDAVTGEVIAAYFQVRKGRVHETREYADGAVFADYNRQGELLGIEVLSPCRVTIVDQIAANEAVDVRRKTKQFMRDSGPQKLIAA